jgi:hypothetical protein
VEKRYRSRRAELADLRTRLRTKGVPIRQIAQVIRARYHVNSRVAYRFAHGLTQQQVASQWNELWPSTDGRPDIDHKHVSYWEAWPLPTGRMPSLDTLNRLARIYRCNAADLLDGEDYTEHHPAVPAKLTTLEMAPVATSDARTEPSDVLTGVDAFIAESGSAVVTREADYQHLVKELIEWACRMNRRDILQWLSWAAASAAAAPALDGLDRGEQERVVRAVASPSRVDSSVVDHVDAVLWRCMRQDDALGPQAALDTVLAQRALVRSFLPEAADLLKDRLLSLYANLSRFAGWLSFDLGNYDAAADYYETARSAAHEAHNTELGAFVLCNMSHLATWRGQPRVGVDHALAALGWANQTDDGRLKAYACDVAARAFAMEGQERATKSIVEQAHGALAIAGRPDTHIYFYGPGQLASTESICYLYLGQTEQGAATAETALAGIDRSFVRNRALASLQLGLCRLRSAKPDVAGGASAIAEAARLASHNRSTRLVCQLRQGWQELTPWHDVPEVADLRHQLTAYGFD